MDLTEWKKMNRPQKALVIVQGVNGIGFLVMAPISLFKSGWNAGSLVAVSLLVVPGLLAAFGSYFSFKGQKKGYVFLTAFQILALVSFSLGDWEWELDPLVSLKIWIKLGGPKLGVDILELVFLALVLQWLKQRKPSSV